MANKEQGFPRAVYDDDGNYTIRTGAIYRVDDLRIRELAEIGYARRDLESAHELIEAYAQADHDTVHPLLGKGLCAAAVVMYVKPFGRNNARTVFKPNQLLEKHLGSDALDLHEYLKRCRDWMIAHDDGLGESKSIGIYLPPSPPRSRLELGLHFPSRRVVALGRDIATRLEPHFAQVRDLVLEHENARREEIATELLRSRFAGVQVRGVVVDEPLEVDIETVISLKAAPGRSTPPE